MFGRRPPEGPWRAYDPIYRDFRAGRLQIHYRRKRRESQMGRFGGGWQWAVGVRVSGSGCVLIDLLVASVTIYVGGRS